MGSEVVTKAVAKKLKYYVDVKRREDGFDLSGPYLPKPEPVPLRPGPTLAYDGLHDRSLKHYFKSPEVKRQVGKMTVPVRKSSRELEIRRFLDTEMAKRSYKLTSGTKSPYTSNVSERSTPKHRPQALISVDEYLKTKRGSQQRKVKPDVIGKPRKVTRRSPPQYVRRNERERLVSMATRLIVATETAALPGNQSSQTKQDSLMYENSLPEVNSRSSYTEDSSDTEISLGGSDAYPRPPSRAGGPRPKWTPPSPNGVEFEQRKQKPHSMLSVASSDTSEDIRDQVKNAKGLVRKTSKKDGNGTRRPNTASPTVRKKTLELSLPHSQYRSHSARASQRTNKQNGEWKKNGKKNKHQISNFSFMESSDEERNKKVNNSHHDGNEVEVPDSKLFYKRPRQNMNALRSRVLTYKVYVVTSNQRGASTDADVKLTLFGDSGSSGERCLLKSMNHSRKFRKGQVDIFPIDSICLGDLQNIRIGHTQTSQGKGWFLEKVFVSEGAKENRVFEFPCKRWFSSEKDDGQIIRDISVSQILSESELTDELDNYASPAEQTSDDESDVSYSSVESTEQAKEVEDKRVSSEEEEISENETREKSHDRGKEDGETKEDGRKKMVSFEKEEEDESDSEEEKRESEEECERSEKEEKNNAGESSLAGAEDNTEVKKTEEDVPGKSVEEEDFWSNSSDKGEAIHYDLGVDDNNEISKDVENASSRGSTPSSTSSPDSNPKSSDNERAENEEEDRKKDGEHSENGQGSGGEGEKEKPGDENEGEMVETPRNENVKDRDDVRSDQSSNEDYMSGFVAGVRASEHDNQQQKDEGHEDDTTLDDSMEDGDFILRKGPSLHSAVASGNVERVKELMEHNPSLKEQTDEKGWTPLHVGCANGQLECVKVIALCAGNLEQETPTGYTSMHLAAMNGHVNCMMVLFGLGAEISCRTIDEYTPLHLAAMSGHVECVKWLLANRVKHNATDVNGRTPVEIAEEYCHEEVANLLKSFNKEMTKSDSTLAHLMTYEGHRKKSTDSVVIDTAGTLNKIADSGVGGLETGEESWVSDNENEDEEDEENTSKSVSGRPNSARRASSARSDDSVTSVNKTDSMASIKEKQDLYQRQRQQMKKRNSSFLDSIRMDVEDDKQD